MANIGVTVYFLFLQGIISFPEKHRLGVAQKGKSNACWRSFSKGSGPSARFFDEENRVADDGEAAEKHGRDRNERIQQPTHSNRNGNEVVET